MGEPFKALADPTRRRILQLLNEGRAAGAEHSVPAEPDGVSGAAQMVLRFRFGAGPGGPGKGGTS